MSSLLSFILFSHNSALWLVWGSLILSIFTPVSNLTLLLPAVALGGAVSTALSSRKLLRFIGILPAAAALLLCRGLGDFLLAVPTVVYLFLCIYRNTLQPDPDAFFRANLELIVIAAGTLICIAIKRPWAFRCGVIGMGCQVYLMRLLRHDHLQPRVAALEFLPIGSICGLCILLSTNAALRAAAFVLKKLYAWVISPLILFFLNIFLGILWCLSKLFKPLSIDFGSMEEVKIENFWQDILPEQSEFETGVPFPKAVTYLIGAALFLLIVFLVYRYFKKGTVGRTPAVHGNDSMVSTLSDDRQSSSGGHLNRTPEAKIRRIYAAYCKDQINRGILLTPDDTTRSIEQKAGASDSADALRDLYLRARYSTGSGLTSTDAKQAAALYKQLRKSEE